MQIIETSNIWQERAAAVTIGCFDGVHLGHRALIAETCACARAEGLLSVVLTFAPHPSAVFTGKPVPLLLTSAEKRDIIETLGADVYIDYPFTKSFAALPPETFFRDVLVDALQCKTLVVGADFRFGQGGAGHIELAEQLGGELGIRIVTVPDREWNGAKISSSRIRALVQAQRFADAAQCLGAPYTVGGTVMEGKHLGRAIGYPTMNLHPPADRLLPPDGVYLTRTLRKGVLYDGLTNVGISPTVGGHTQLVETHLLDFAADTYGERIHVQFIEYLRGETRFTSVGALKSQITADEAAARRCFARAKAAD